MAMTSIGVLLLAEINFQEHLKWPDTDLAASTQMFKNPGKTYHNPHVQEAPHPPYPVQNYKNVCNFRWPPILVLNSDFHQGFILYAYEKSYMCRLRLLYFTLIYMEEIQVIIYPLSLFAGLC